MMFNFCYDYKLLRVISITKLIYMNANIDSPTIPNIIPAFPNLLPVFFDDLAPNIIANTPVGNVIYQNSVESVEIIPSTNPAIPIADLFLLFSYIFTFLLQ